MEEDGELDPLFTVGTGANDFINSIVILSNGKIIISGEFTSYDGVGRNKIARLNSDGSLDTSFDPGTGGNNEIITTVVQSDGKIIIGGAFTSYDGTVRNRIARLNEDGDLDMAFVPGIGASALVRSTSLQSNGKIIIGGSFLKYNGITRNRIARLNTDGSLDASFDPGTGSDAAIFTTSIHPNGKIIIGGSITSYNGTTRHGIAFLNADGTLDSLFDSAIGTDPLLVRTASFQPEGKIIIGGDFNSYNGTSKKRLIKINSAIIVNMSTPNNYLLSSVAHGVSAQPYTSPGVKKYRFSIKNNLTGVTQEVISVTRFVSIPGNMRNYDASYDIKASAVVDDVVSDYAGNTITVFTPGIQLVKLTNCGATVDRLGATISSTVGLNAISYTFRARLSTDNGPSPTYYSTTASASRFTSMTSFVGLVPQYDATYAISVSYSYTDVATSTVVESAYGDECLVKMPNIPTVGLASPTCGTTLTRMGQTISAYPAPQAISYEFRIRLTSDNGPTPVYNYTLSSASRFSSMSSFQGLMLMDDTSYTVSVHYQVMVDGVAVWADYGAECVLTTPESQVIATRTVKTPFTAVAYPNPFANSFLLDVKSSYNSPLDIRVYDMLGRLVEQKQANVNDLETTTIGNNYPSGVYNVIVTQDDETKTVRVVKR